MQFSVTFPISTQLMIIVIVNQPLLLISSGNKPDYIIQKIRIISSLHRKLIIFFKSGGPFDFVPV